ncbi:hypothetical protein glysoja_045962, partial [Glycine soja]
FCFLFLFTTVSCFFFRHHSSCNLFSSLFLKKNGSHHFQLDTHKTIPNSRL